MKICVIGTGYVGLVQGTCLADLGNNVVCVDKSKEKIKLLDDAICPFYEPRISEMIQHNKNASRLTFTTNLNDGIKSAEIVFVAVGTPPDEDGKADLSQIFTVIDEIGQFMKSIPQDRRLYRVIAMKSTVPVGTCQKAIDQLVAMGLSEHDDFDVVSNPEFLREGSAVSDFFRPDRVVVGGKTKKATSLVGSVYSTLYRIENPLITTDLETSELSKYASNAFLATKISFINELANFCDAVGADIHTIASVMGSDGRISKYFLHPGPGYGGSCFPKDTQALVAQGNEHNVKLGVIQSTIEANKYQSSVVIKKLITLLGTSDLSNKTIAVLGLAFKPNTDDMRDAPSIPILHELDTYSATIKAFDPKAMDNAKPLLPSSVDYQDDIYSTIDNSDIILILTEWNSFRNLNFERVKSIMRTPIILDARNMYASLNLKSKGFTYNGVGRS